MLVNAQHLNLITFPRWIRVQIGYGVDAFRLDNRKHI